MSLDRASACSRLVAPGDLHAIPEAGGSRPQHWMSAETKGLETTTCTQV